MNCRRMGSLSSAFDALERNEVLSLLVQRIAQLPPMPKKVLAMYYHENLRLAEIAACFALPEYQIEETLIETVDLLRKYSLSVDRKK